MESVRELEARYRFIFESANVGLWEEDYSEVKRAVDALRGRGVRDFRRYFADHPEEVQELFALVRILDVNEQTLKMHGAGSKAELLGSLSKIAVPEALPVFQEALVCIAEGRGHFEAEVPGRTLQGGTIDTIIRVTIPRNNEGFRNLIVSTIDISDRKGVEKALQRSEARYRAIFDAAKVSLWEADISELKTAMDELKARGVEGIPSHLDQYPEVVTSCLEKVRVVGVNRETLRMYEAESESQLLGSLTRVFAVEALDDFKELMLAVAEGRGFVEREIKGRTLRGRTIDTLLSASLPPDAAGYEHVIFTIIDLTEHKRLEREMLKTQKLESLGLLAGGIAHDFNNILTAILGNVSLLAETHRGDEDSRRMLEDLRKAVLRAQGLTHQLLTFSKGGEPVRRSMSLGALISETVSFALSGSNVVSRFEVPKDLWGVQADQGQISQVFHNLALNAAQAMPDGGTLTVSAENHRDRAGRRFLRITLRDEGVGIPERYLDKIFDPYFSTKPEGSGLGLSVVYSVVKRHGGFVEAVSSPGKGSSFTVHLPAFDAPAPAPADAPRPLQAGARILLMDDEALIRRVAGQMLEALGFEVTCVSDGAEAVAAYRGPPAGGGFDAVILDLTVPGKMGGLEALRLLRDLDPPVRAIVSSGYSTDPVLSRFREYGFRSALGKPFTLEDLRRVLGQALAGPD